MWFPGGCGNRTSSPLNHHSTSRFWCHILKLRRQSTRCVSIPSWLFSRLLRHLKVLKLCWSWTWRILRCFLTKHDSQEILRSDVLEESFPVNFFNTFVFFLRENPLENFRLIWQVTLRENQSSIKRCQDTWKQLQQLIKLTYLLTGLVGKKVRKENLLHLQVMRSNKKLFWFFFYIFLFFLLKWILDFWWKKMRLIQIMIK